MPENHSRRSSLFIAWFLGAGPALVAADGAVTVTQITSGPKHHYFGYIGQSRTVPWNAGGRYVLALETDFQDRLPGVNDPAGICLLDTRAGHSVRVIDRSRAWNPQQGTMFY